MMSFEAFKLLLSGKIDPLIVLFHICNESPNAFNAAIRRLYGDKPEAFTPFNPETGRYEYKDGCKSQSLGDLLKAKLVDQNAVALVATHLRNNLTVTAVKEFREATGLGLRESKDAVDYIRYMVGWRNDPPMHTVSSAAKPLVGAVIRHIQTQYLNV